MTDLSEGALKAREEKWCQEMREIIKTRCLACHSTDPCDCAKWESELSEITPAPENNIEKVKCIACHFSPCRCKPAAAIWDQPYDCGTGV